MKLTEKQKRFVDAYIETGNAAEAARKAGYSWKTANRTGAENLSKPVIKDAVEARLKEIESKRTASITEVMEYLTSVMRGEVTEQVVVVEGQGDGCSEARLIEKPPSINDRNKAAEQILKRYGRFPKLEEEKMQLEVDKLRTETEALARDKGTDGTDSDVIIMLPEKEDGEGELGG